MSICQCGDSLIYAGKSSYDKAKEAITAIAVVRTFDDAGNKNVIPKGTVMDTAYIESKVYAEDPSQRWNIIQNLDTYQGNQPDPTFFTGSNTSVYKVQDNTQMVKTATIPNRSSVYAKQLNGLFCESNQYSYFEIDKCNNEWGIEEGDDIAPFALSSAGSFCRVDTASLADGTVTTVRLSLALEITNDFKSTVGIAGSAIEENLNTITNVQSINAEFSNITTTGFTVELSGNFGFDGAKNPVVGIVLDDVTMLDDSGAEVAITSFEPQTTANIYDAVFATQAAGNYTLSIFSTAGYELAATTFTIV